MKSGGKDPSVSSNLPFFFPEHGSDIRVNPVGEPELAHAGRSIVRFPVDGGHIA